MKRGAREAGAGCGLPALWLGRRRLLRAAAGVMWGSAGAAATGCGWFPSPGATAELPGSGGRATPGTQATIVATYAEFPAEVPTYKRLFRLAEARYPGLKIDEVGIPGSAAVEKVTAMFAGGTPPDAIRMSGAGEYTFFAAKRMTQPVDRYLQRAGTLQKDFVPFALQGGQWRGKQVALAYHLGGNAMFLNQTLIDQAGVTPPAAYERQGKWSWDTLLMVLKGVSAESGDARIWGMDRIDRLGAANAWIYSAGGELYDQDMTESRFTHPKTLQALGFLVDLAVKHHVVPTQSELAGQPDPFLAGRQAMLFGSRFNAPPIETARTAAGWRVGMILPPAGPSGQTVTRDSPISYGMGSQTQHPDAVWALMSFFASPEGQRIYAGAGLGLPVLRSLYTPEVLKDVLFEWEDPSLYLRSVQLARIQVPPAYPAIDQVFRREMNLAFEGQKAVKEAAEAIKLAADALLKQDL